MEKGRIAATTIRILKLKNSYGAAATEGTEFSIDFIRPPIYSVGNAPRERFFVRLTRDSSKFLSSTFTCFCKGKKHTLDVSSNNLNSRRNFKAEDNASKMAVVLGSIRSEWVCGYTNSSPL